MSAIIDSQGITLTDEDYTRLGRPAMVDVLHQHQDVLIIPGNTYTTHGISGDRTRIATTRFSQLLRGSFTAEHQRLGGRPIVRVLSCADEFKQGYHKL